VRTDLEKLDHLISDTYELFRSTTNALALAGTSQKKQAQLGPATEGIRDSFMRLQSELINLRMVSLGPLLQRALRMGRTAARAAQKQIEFEIAGKELRVDKVMGDALADPLIHLVRNAVDHGIESASEREQAGKSATARIQIEALSEGSQTRIRVSDDGRGIDPVVISEAAARLGLIGDRSKLDVERSLRLIFRPGFTTLASATNVSGRGVGLDVVETAVENVGGELRVSSRLGAGTTFEIRLPVTFGLLTVTVLVTNGQRYCIPASQVTNIENVSPTKSAKRTSSTNLVELNELLGYTRKKSGRKIRKLVTFQVSAADGSAAKTFQLMVDDVESSQEVLVRSLGRHGGRWYGVSGAAELGDGSVALVLDLVRLQQAFAN
jgi:two-component system chemotaxis sensor kinase CheA